MAVRVAEGSGRSDALNFLGTGGATTCCSSETAGADGSTAAGITSDSVRVVACRRDLGGCGCPLHVAQAMQKYHADSQVISAKSVANPRDGKQPLEFRMK